MGRAHVAAVGLGLLVLVSIAIANPPADTIAAVETKAGAAAPTDGGSPAVPADDPALLKNPEYLHLKQQNTDLNEALTQVQLQLQKLKAETEMRSAVDRLKRVADRYPHLAAGQSAALLLRTLNDPAAAPGVDASASANPGDEAWPAFIDFAPMVVNLDDGRLNRYLLVDFSLQTSRSSYGRISQAILRKKALVQDSLTSYLSDKTLSEVRGSSAQDLIRRDIKDRLNTLLFPDGSDEIEAVLFQQFAIQ